MKILVTSGATQEPIDGVRFITNFSSGRTAATLAELLAARHSVTFIHGRTSMLPKAPTHNLKYQAFQDLDRILRSVLKENVFDLIVHAAAISDYSVSHIELNGKPCQPGEIPKIDSGEELTIRTRRNFKIINRLKDYALSNPGAAHPPILVGFKLTNTPDRDRQRQEVDRLAAQTPIDLIVHNDLHEMQTQGVHLFNVYRNGQILRQGMTLPELGDLILKICPSLRENAAKGEAKE